MTNNYIVVDFTSSLRFKDKQQIVDRILELGWNNSGHDPVSFYLGEEPKKEEKMRYKFHWSKPIDPVFPDFIEYEAYSF